jgi:nucleoside-diphosphate-sugar epimerase
MLANQRILLVGGAGFIGHHLALACRAYGASVMVADNLMVNNLVANAYGENGERHQLYQNFLADRFELMRAAGVQLRNADARILADLNLIFQEFKPTKVVHLAAISSAVEARKNPGLAFDLQLVTLRNTLELARLHEVGQVVLMSSSTVYGDFETATVDESMRPRPRGIYASTKYMAERLVRTYNQQHGLGTTIIRPSALYGERCISRRVSQVFIENALTGRPLLLEGGGDGRLDFTSIGDLVEGICRALALPAEPGTSQTFNLTFGNARTIAELAAIVKSVIPSAILEDRPRADKPIRGTLSTARAESVLGFKARHGIETGYRAYVEWYVEQWDRARMEYPGARRATTGTPRQAQLTG